MTQVDESIRFWPQLGSIEQGLSPVPNSSGIEIRLKSLVFDKHLPVGRQGCINFFHTFQRMLKSLPEIQLPRKTGAVGQPDSERLRAQLFPITDDFDIVVDRLFTHFFTHMLQRPEFIAVWLTRLVLEGIGIHGIEAQPKLGAQGLDGSRLTGDIPGNMQGDGPAAAVEGMQKTDVFYLFFQAARLAATGKTSKTRPAGRKRPTCNGLLEIHQLLQHP